VTTTFKPNKIFTLINKDKLDLTKGIVRASSAIFMRTVQYLDKTHLRIDHRYPSYLNVPHNFITINFHDIYLFRKPQMHVGDMIEINIQIL
jgi:hypothetical protein